MSDNYQISKSCVWAAVVLLAVLMAFVIQGRTHKQTNDTSDVSSPGPWPAPSPPQARVYFKNLSVGQSFIYHDKQYTKLNNQYVEYVTTQVGDVLPMKLRNAKDDEGQLHHFEEYDEVDPTLRVAPVGDE